MVRHSTFKHIIADAKDAEVASVRAVDEIAQASFDDAGTKGDQPEVGQSDNECEAS